MSISKIKIYASVEVPINLSCLLVSQLATPTNSSQSDIHQVESLHSCKNPFNNLVCPNILTKFLFLNLSSLPALMYYFVDVVFILYLEKICYTQ